MPTHPHASWLPRWPATLRRRDATQTLPFVDRLPASLRVSLLLPALVIAVGLTLYPLLLAIVTSLESKTGITLERYVGFFNDPKSYAALQRTLGLAFAATLGSIVLSLPLAYVIRRTIRHRTFLRILVTTPLAIPVLIAAYALTVLFSERGLLNNLLVEVLHVLPEPLRLSYTWPGLILACIWRYFPFSALVIIAALEALDPAVEEAAYIAGARPHQVFLRIVLPLLAPALFTGGVITFVGVFGTFSMPLIMGGGGQDVLAVVAYREIEGHFDFGSASTIVVMMAAIQLLLFGVLRRAVRR
jgi:ABC-type Fe3+ transport system permease subunit